MGSGLSQVASTSATCQEAEAIFELKASRAGFIISRPLVDIGYDRIVDYDSALFRVQIKGSARKFRPRGRNLDTYRFGAQRKIGSLRKTAFYCSSVVDYFAFVACDTQMIWIVPVADITSSPWQTREGAHPQYEEAWHLMKGMQ